MRRAAPRARGCGAAARRGGRVARHVLVKDDFVDDLRTCRAVAASSSVTTTFVAISRARPSCGSRRAAARHHGARLRSRLGAIPLIASSCPAHCFVPTASSQSAHRPYPLDGRKLCAASRCAEMCCDGQEKTDCQEERPTRDATTEEILTTTELVALAKKRLPEAAWDFVVGGAETETTIIRNRHALDSIAFRPRVLRNVEDASPATTFLGMKQRIPVLLAPIASLTDVDPEGALPVARAAAQVRLPDARQQRHAAVVRGGRARGRRAVRAAALHRRRREVGRRYCEARRAGRCQGACA